jgi:two-component system, sensor histidine kinase
MTDHPRIHILVIDDNETERFIFHDLLAAQGHEVLLASDGFAGLSMAWEHRPDLILLDVMMAGLDGFEVCERLRAEPSTAEVPIILLTALSDRQSRLRGLQVGADEFLTKPIDTIELRMRVQTIARLNRYRHLLDERQRAVSALAQARDAALDASRVKSEFLAVVSHELVTPLNGIIGMADLLLMMPLDTSQREYVRIMHASGTDLLATVRNLLDYASLEAGKISLYEGVFSIAQAIQHAVASLSLRAGTKGLSLRAAVAADVPESVYGDGELFEHVLMELLGNAIMFTSEGEILTSADLVSVSADGVTLAVHVRDSGIGIAEDVQPRLFQPFSRADSSSTRRTRGMGLGLAVARLRVDLLGGMISVASAAGQGSTFSVVLTFKQVTPDAPAECP